MQILLEKIENGDFLHPKVIGEFIKYNLLEKEKDHTKYFAFKFRHESFTLKDIEKEYDAVYREKHGSLNEQDDHVDPMVAKAYRDYIKAKKDSAADIDFAEDPGKAYRYYSKKLNNTYSTRADRDAIEAILKKKIKK